MSDDWFAPADPSASPQRPQPPSPPITPATAKTSARRRAPRLALLSIPLLTASVLGTTLTVWTIRPSSLAPAGEAAQREPLPPAVVATPTATPASPSPSPSLHLPSSSLRPSIRASSPSPTGSPTRRPAAPSPSHRPRSALPTASPLSTASTFSAPPERARKPRRTPAPRSGQTPHRSPRASATPSPTSSPTSRPDTGRPQPITSVVLHLDSDTATLTLRSAGRPVIWHATTYGSPAPRLRPASALLEAGQAMPVRVRAPVPRDRFGRRICTPHGGTVIIDWREVGDNDWRETDENLDRGTLIIRLHRSCNDNPTTTRCCNSGPSHPLIWQAAGAEATVPKGSRPPHS